MSLKESAPESSNGAEKEEKGVQPFVTIEVNKHGEFRYHTNSDPEVVPLTLTELTAVMGAVRFGYLLAETHLLQVIQRFKHKPELEVDEKGLIVVPGGEA